MDQRHLGWMLRPATWLLCQRPAAHAVRRTHGTASASSDPAQAGTDRIIRVPLISAACATT